MNNPFRRWHILLTKQTKVAARDSRPSEKQHCEFVCDELLPDSVTIQQALDSLNYPQYRLCPGNNGEVTIRRLWEWVEVKRKREWRWPWQPSIRVTKHGQGGRIVLEGTFDVTEAKEEL